MIARVRELLAADRRRRDRDLRHAPSARCWRRSTARAARRSRRSRRSTATAHRARRDGDPARRRRAAIAPGARGAPRRARALGGDAGAELRASRRPRFLRARDRREGAGDAPAARMRRRLPRALAARGIEPVLEPLLDHPPRPRAARGLRAVARWRAGGAVHQRQWRARFCRGDAAARSPAFAVGDCHRCRGARMPASPTSPAPAARSRISRRLVQRAAAAGGRRADPCRRQRHRRRSRAARSKQPGFALRRAVLYEAVPAERLSADDRVAACRAARSSSRCFSLPALRASFVRLAATPVWMEGCRAMTAVALSPAVATTLAPLPWRASRWPVRRPTAALLAALDAHRGHGCGTDSDGR